MNKTLASLLMGALLFPMASFAATTAPTSSQILQLIASLTAQLQTLQAQVKTPSSAPAAPSAPVAADEISARMAKQSVHVSRSQGFHSVLVAKYTFNVEVTAGNNDLYIPLSTGDGKNYGFNPSVSGPTTAVASLTVKCSGKSTEGVTNAGVFYCHIPAKTTASFAFQGQLSKDTGTYTLSISAINYKLNPTDKSPKVYQPKGIKTDPVTFQAQDQTSH